MGARPDTRERAHEARSALAACLDGALPPAPALVRILMHVQDQAAAERLLTLDASARAGLSVAHRRRLTALQDLLSAHPKAWADVNGILAAVSHQPDARRGLGATLADLASAFDRAAALSPESSVALYSLGSPDRLAAATREVVDAMAAWGLLGPDRDVLEIGCGIGRFQQALAGRVRRCVGIDISERMIAEARRRCARLPGVEIYRTSGRDLGAFADASLDLVFAVDSFPYLVLAGADLARRHVEEAARVLRHGGGLLIFNYSYARDSLADSVDIAYFASAHRFRVLRDGVRPFSTWDGSVHHLVREPA